MKHRAEKIQIAEQVVQTMKSNSAVLVCKRLAMDAPDMQSLRVKMSIEANAVLRIIKNRVFSKAIEADKMAGQLVQYLKGNTLLIMSNDIAKTVTALSNFHAKDKIEYVGGVVDNTYCSQETFKVLSKFNSAVALQSAPAAFLLSSLSLVMHILKIKSEGESEMIVSKEKVQEVFESNAGVSENAKSLVEKILNASTIDCANVYQILSQILGIDMSAMSVGSGSGSSEAKSEESDDASGSMIITLTDTKDMNKLQAVKHIRGAFPEMSTSDVLGLLKACGALPELPADAAKKLLQDLTACNVIGSAKPA